MTTGELRALPLIEAPLVAFDCETTGVDPQEARIVEFGSIRKTRKTAVAAKILFNPGVPRESWLEAQKVCEWMPDELDTIYASQSFARIGMGINGALTNRVVIGYNLLDYDIPLLLAEQKRAGLPRTEFPFVIDVLVIVRRFLRHLRERNLGAVSKLLKHQGIAHRAVADCWATLHILDHAISQGWLAPAVEKACDQIMAWKVEQDADWELYGYWLYRDWLKRDAPLTIGAGKSCGMLLSRVDPGLIRWYLNSEIKFTQPTRDALTAQLKR